MRVKEGGSTSGDFVVKGKSNNKLVRKGAPPITRGKGASSSVNVDEIMKKYSITHHAIASNVSQEFITVKNKLLRKSLIKDPSTFTISAAVPLKKPPRYCIHFARGYCKDLNCKYVHSTERVNACKNLLQYGRCQDAESGKCQFNHTLTPNNTPLCLYHCERGNCNHPDTCMYSHFPPESADALICQEFAQSSYCELGQECPQKHLNICPDFYSTGTCIKGSACRLKHMNLKSQQQQTQILEQQAIEHQIQVDPDPQVVEERDEESATDYIAFEDF